MAKTWNNRGLLLASLIATTNVYHFESFSPSTFNKRVRSVRPSSRSHMYHIDVASDKISNNIGVRVGRRSVLTRKTALFGEAPSSSKEEDENANDFGKGTAEEFAELKKIETKIEGRKNRVTIGYSISSGFCTIAVLMGIVKSSFSPATAYIVAGPALAAGIADVLQSAAVNNRLSSDTYKRLNLGMIQFGFVNVIICALAKELMHPRFWLPWIIVSFITFVNSIKGFGYGVKGWALEGGMSKVVDDIKEGIKGNLKTLTTIPNATSFMYLAAFVSVFVLKMLKLFELFQMISLSSTPMKSDLFVTRLSGYAKIALLTITTFTLKDAADRDRLRGTTFIKLNVLTSFVFGSMAAFWWQISGKAVTIPAGVAVLFSVGILGTAVRSILQKREKTD